MNVGNAMVVDIQYTLKNNNGDILDQTQGDDALSYIHGAGNIIPGLEEVLENLGIGSDFEVTIPPEKAYGVFSEELIQEVPKESFPNDIEVEVGQQFYVEGPEGPQPIAIKEIRESTIVIDGNHDLAGETLNFTGKVVGIREATQSELDHGHLHQHGEECGGDHQ